MADEIIGGEEAATAISATVFSCGAASATLVRAPSRPFAADTRLFQTTAVDSLGNRYVVDRSAVTVRPVVLTFPRVTAAELAALRTFLYTTVAGARTKFTWTDSAAVAHTVRLTAWHWRQTGPAWFQVDMQLEETL